MPELDDPPVSKLMEEITSVFFKFDPELSVAVLLKTGILNTFNKFHELRPTRVRDLRTDLTQTLLALAAIRIPPVKKPGRKKVKKCTAFRYLSARHKALNEFFIDEDTDEPALDHFEINGKDHARFTLTTRYQRVLAAANERNSQFKLMLEDWIADFIATHTHNAIARPLLHGVYATLILSEDQAGPFVEQFAKHQVLFEQLATVYETAAVQDLDKQKGCYSHGLAVDEALAMLERV